MRKISILFLLFMTMSMPLHARESDSDTIFIDNAAALFTTLRELYEKQNVAETQPKPEIQRYFVVLNHTPEPRRAVALTFDDGGSYSQVMAILEVLRENQAKATFFLLGQWADDNPDLVRHIAGAGHEIANHSYYHPSFTQISAERISSEVSRTQTVLQEYAGAYYRPYFRPPYGEYDGRALTILEEMGYHALVMWNVDSRDWTGVAGTVMAERVLNQTGDGSILLFHLHGAHTAEALRYVLPALQVQGYRFSSISEML